MASDRWNFAGRVRRTRKPCYFRFRGRWWVAAEFGGEVFVHDLKVRDVRLIAA